MIINPKYILDKGILTLPTNIDTKTVLQPNGIDLQVDKIYELLPNTASVHVGDDIKTVHKKSVELALDKHSHCYELKRLTPYKAETAYTVKLPSDMVAYIFTRSTLNRNGILIGSGLWDSGFEGSVGTTIYPMVDLSLHNPCRIAQIVFMQAQSAFNYAGTYGTQKGDAFQLTSPAKGKGANLPPLTTRGASSRD